MRVIDVKLKGEPHKVYLWRFREEPGSKWLAGISGPYLLKGDPHPINGQLTFSQFQEWDKATPEQHVAAIVKMFDEYNKRNSE